LHKGEVIRGHGALTADLNGSKASSVETTLILADSKTDITGEVVAALNGDTVGTAQQVHTLVKDGTYVSPKTATNAKFLNLVVYANHAPVTPGESLKLMRATVSYSRTQPVAEATEPTPVRTSVLDTGPSSELVSSVPIYKTWEPSVEKTVYSLPVASLKGGEALRATGNIELTGMHSYGVSASVRLVLGSDPTDANGVVVTPRANVTMTPKMSHVTLPIDGVYSATADLGTQYLKLVAKAPAWEAQEGDTLMVESNRGRLTATRYTPTPGPTSLPTHELQSSSSASEQITSIPVDSKWRAVLSSDVDEITTEDRLDFAAQLEVGHPPPATGVKLESRLIAATTPTGTEPGPNGWLVSEDTTDMLTADKRFARIVQSNVGATNDPAKHYINLLVRAVPVGEASPIPLTVNAGSAVLKVLRFRPTSLDPIMPLRPGTFESVSFRDPYPELTSVPFAANSKPEPRVVNSRPLYYLRKGDVIRGHGIVTADLSGAAGAQIETALIVANQKSDTTGEVLAPLSGDTLSADEQIHTVIQGGAYVAPKASYFPKYLNLVVYANRSPAYPNEELKLSRATLSASRTQPTLPFSADFEDGSLDQFFRYGKATDVSTNQAREGTKALQVDVDSESWWPLDEGQDPTKSIRRAEVIPPDTSASGGYAGADRWFGWSVYFPESFKAPAIDDSYFDGIIDEVRLFDEPLSKNQIEADRKGEYAANPSPTAAYSFNENQGEIAHDSVGSHDGVLEGADWTSSGRYGAALDFNGVRDLVRIADANDLDFTNAFTLEAWVRPDSVRWWSPIISKTEGPENYSGYLLNAGFHHFPAGFTYDAGSTKEVTDFSSELPTMTWSHLALTSDGSALRIYVNGQLKASAPAISAASNGADLTIGTNELNPGMNVGPWDIFTQWHHGEEGIECETKSSVPIAFSATHYLPGYLNPGETKTATPVEGDYINLMLNGGQLDEECDSVKPTQYYILAPLEHGHWYDFVLHTRWTTEEGGPGNSVTEVWINGKQVLGNQTSPVWKPSLYWRGNPEHHNSTMSWQVGLYRGPSAEDPATRLFVDSMKVGRSYGEVAPESHASRVDAERYPVVLDGTGPGALETSIGTFECQDTGMQGFVSSATREIALGAEFDACSAGQSGELSSATTMNSCHYVLNVRNAAPPYEGNFDIVCEKPGDAIEFKAYEDKALICTARVGPQAGLQGIGLTNTGEGAQRGIGIHKDAKGLKYDLNGAGCSSEVRTDGAFSWTGNLLGFDDEDKQVGVSLTGGAFTPRIEAESYDAILEGKGFETFTTHVGTFTCGQTSLQGVTGNAASQLSLDAAYSSCTATSSKFPSTVEMNNCQYTLNIDSASLPYMGDLGVSCREKNEAIEFKSYAGSSLLCTIKIGPQQALNGLGFSNAGQGTGRSIQIHAAVKGVKYEQLGKFCASETRSDGEVSGDATLLGMDENNAKIGAYLAGEP
jgi:Concanavalin A-like lectin/glucanases superfamily